MARTAQAYSTSSQAPMLQRVWQSMRVMRRFTSAELIATAEAGETAVQKFIKAMHLTGYLRLQVPRVSGRAGSRDVWVLVRDSGPIVPIRRYDGTGVFDPNTGVFWGMSGLPMADVKDHDAVARALLAKYQDQQGEAHE